MGTWQIIGWIIMVVGIILNILLAFHRGPRGGYHDPIIDNDHPTLFKVLSIALIVIGFILVGSNGENLF